jgi:hypothetical protein
MGYTVVWRGDMTESMYREYLRQVGGALLRRGIGLEHVPRTLLNEGNGERWFYVWDSEQGARDFIEGVKARTDMVDWEVRPVEGPVCEGPLQPLEIAIGRAVESVTLGLEVMTRLALRARFPGSCQTTSISVRTSYDWRGKVSWQASLDGLRTLAEQVLPILTGLQPEQLGIFGTYRVVDSVTEQVLIPPTPIHGGVGDAPPNGPGGGDGAKGGSRCQALR